MAVEAPLVGIRKSGFRSITPFNDRKRKLYRINAISASFCKYQLGEAERWTENEYYRNLKIRSPKISVC